MHTVRQRRRAQSDSEDAGVYFFTGLSRAEKSNTASGTWSGRTRWARWLRSQESTREEGKPCVGRKTSSCAFLTAASKITPDGPGPPSAALGMAVGHTVDRKGTDHRHSRRPPRYVQRENPEATPQAPCGSARVRSAKGKTRPAVARDRRRGGSAGAFRVMEISRFWPG